MLDDVIIFGLLMAILAFVLYTSNSTHRRWKTFYKFVPPLLICYFAPALLHWPLGWVDPSDSSLYYVASRYLLPASLVLLCLSIDIEGIRRLGSKAIITFLMATLGIVIGGPIAVITIIHIAPDFLNADPDKLWRGLSTIAGSWIGGGANQTAMKEIFQVSDDLFGTMLIVDLLIGNIWIGLLLYGAGIHSKIDSWLNADTTAIEALKRKVENYRMQIERIPQTKDLFVLMGVAFGSVAISHYCASYLVPFFKQYETTITNLRLNSILSHFFWLIVIATTIGFLLSFTRAKKLEGIGASRWGSLFIYILVATIGMKMNLREVFDHLGLFSIGIVWMMTHVLILIITAKIIRAPFFFVAVGSTANVGGAASAPVVASAFGTSLAPVGALLAVLGYAIGTYGAIVCAFLMQLASST